MGFRKTMQSKLTEDIVVPVVQKSTATALYAGAGGGFFFGLTAHEFAALASIVIAIIGLIGNLWINWYWKKRHYDWDTNHKNDGKRS